MTLKYQQAVSWLDNNPNASVAELKNIVTQLSAEVPGAKTTILYSETINGIESWRIAENMASNNPDIATINKTDVAKFLEERSFIDTLRTASIKEGISFDEVYAGKNSDGVRISSDSMWDIASKNLAQNASGDVRTIAPLTNDNSIFKQTELPTLLNNPKVTSIDGISIEELRATYNNAGGAEGNGVNSVYQKVQQGSIAHYSLLEVAETADGNIAVGTNKFFESHPTINGTPLPEDAINIKTGARLLGEDGRLSNFIESIEDSNLLSRSTLNKLGVAGDILSLTIATYDANAAYNLGDNTKAAQILADWSADFVGGIAGGMAAGAITAQTVAPLLAFGAPGAIAAGILTFSAGLAGGIGGGALVKDLLHRAEDLQLFNVKEAGEAIANVYDTIANEAQSLLTNLTTSTTTIAQSLLTAYSQFQSSISIAATVLRDPLIIDGNHDGLELNSWQDSNVLFDLNNDGISESSGWVKPDLDGGDELFLAIDKNSNGNIDGIDELFGNDTTGGFAELSAFDSNKDSFIEQQII